MRTAKLFVLFPIVCLLLVSISARVHSDGIIIPPPEVQMAIKYHKVSVSIDDQIATTKVDQVFINQSSREIEGTYIFPLPEGVAMTRFVMYVEGKPLEAEFLDSKTAREIYEEIVRKRRDPAILEYMGRGAFRARIFPISPWGEKRIQLEYSEVLPYDAGLSKYVYPLNTEKFSSIPLELVEVSVDLKSHVPIKSIWSPSHENKIVMERGSEYSARIVYADEGVIPDIDFALYYTVSEDDFGLNLMTYREPPDDGFYVLMAAPKYEISEEEVVNKNVVFVFDTSGSMATDNKIGQARDALEFCVRKLNEHDEFNIIDFGSGIRKFSSKPVQADAMEIQSALKYIEKLDASGGTNINDALLEALKQISLASNPLSMIIFLTDGLPTVGVTFNDQIIKNVGSANIMDARLFVFGVGYDVNTRLLDGLAIDNDGVSAYVRPEEDIEIVVSSFFAKISNPVLSDIALDFGFINTTDRYPTQLPDLFAGSQLREFGRYRNSGNMNITLSGMAGGKVRIFLYGAQFLAENTENDFIPRIWASRKIGYLIDEVRRNGETPELVEEIMDLSIKYGIINEYISMLILEDEPPPPGAFGGQLADEEGENAVDASVALREWKEADVAPTGAQSADVKLVGSKIFIKKDGVWTDAEYKTGSPDIVVQYSSDDYFSLLASDTEMGKYFALGSEVIFYHNGELYQIQEGASTGVDSMGDEESDNTQDEATGSEEFDTGLLQNYPNPFNPDTWIPYKLSKASDIVIKIYDVRGKLIRTLDPGYKTTGIYKTKSRAAYWDGKNSSGEDVASGIYFYILEADEFRSTKKMTLKK
jgi:Ca-activated chloride channel family protein